MSAPHPGPWRTGRKALRTIYSEPAGGESRLIGLMDTAEDARLAAAAPELLDLAKEVAAGRLDYEGDDGFSERVRVLARSAIAKAEGP